MAADSTPRSAPFVPGGKPEAVSIGINSVEWRSATLEQVLQNMQPYGLTLVELIARKNLPKETVPRAKELLAKHGVRANSVSAFTKLNEVVHNGVAETQELINESLEIAAMMGAPFTHTYFGANAFLDDNEAIKRYVEFMKPCLRKAEETGVTLLIDNLFDSVPPEVPATVLLVDDDPAIRSAVKDFLHDEGYTVVSATNGADALNVLRTGLRADVILLDIMMPEMDGWDFRATQLADPALRDIPVVVISASGFAPDTIRKQLKAYEVLGKPLQLGHFLQTLKAACGLVDSEPSASR